jgi:hypothetical protein
MVAMNEEHGPECACCSMGLQAVAEKEREGVEKFGWYGHYVFDAHYQAYGYDFHTHHLFETHGHPDLQLVLPVEPGVANSIFHEIAERAKAGEDFEAGLHYDGVTTFGVMFAEAKENGRRVLRIIVPDGDGNFDEETMDPQYSGQWFNLESADILSDF